MACQILPVYCSVQWGSDLESHRPLICGRRGLKSHGGLCQEHRAEAAEALATERQARR